jgi:uncharacterized membrane protein YedE/YeeE
LFGAGWALSGFCPGTVISGGIFAYSHALISVIGYIIGTYLLRLLIEVKKLAKSRVVRDEYFINLDAGEYQRGNEVGNDKLANEAAEE